MKSKIKKDPFGYVFTPKGTHSEFDDIKIVCGQTHPFLYSDKEKGIYQQIVPCRPVYRYVEDSDEAEDFNGIWIEDGFLFPEKEDEEITYVPGKHIRTITVNFSDFEAIIVELEDILQCSLKNIKTQETIKSCYKDKAHLGSIRSFIENCKDENDASSFLSLLDRLK